MMPLAYSRGQANLALPSPVRVCRSFNFSQFALNVSFLALFSKGAMPLLLKNVVCDYEEKVRVRIYDQHDLLYHLAWLIAMDRSCRQSERGREANCKYGIFFSSYSVLGGQFDVENSELLVPGHLPLNEL